MAGDALELAGSPRRPTGFEPRAAFLRCSSTQLGASRDPALGVQVSSADRGVASGGLSFPTEPCGAPQEPASLWHGVRMSAASGVHEGSSCDLVSPTVRHVARRYARDRLVIR